ncbi:hypothetical protein GHT06_019354 [Daphnia sinensis]|uniref:ALMS motif domain-containing protein n=1 Tax=Daphnia sinensis TaxID=1820382 RepID=A0AAD5KJX3_9CRUS|nr:hypothetical protein GHT06_019354 [Daphnia sinensis]
MDSSEEISDNILSYLENFRDSDTSIIEGENVSTATDNDIYNGSELDNSFNQLTSLSISKSAFSSKKLEWDSSADVGCIPLKTGQFKTKLSTLERMALSTSASKLCLDEDEQSLALIAKIDRVLARSRSIAKVHHKTSRKLQKIATWPSVDSSSNASTDTVIPIVPHFQNGNRENVPNESQQGKPTKSNVKLPSLQTKGEECQTSNTQNSRASQNTKPQLQRSKSTPQYGERASELFVTRSVASEELDLYADNDRPDSSFLATPTNIGNSDADPVSSQCHCVSADFTEPTTCPTHTSLSSEHIRRMRREAVGELQVYRNLKEHLKNLKDYVSQLEQTWKFLDQSPSAIHSRTRERDARRPRTKTHKVPVAEYDELLASSTRNSCSNISESQSTLVNSAESLKSDRSFRLERLNLHDIDSTEETQPTRKSKSKCCNHCSLKCKPAPSAYKKTNYEKGVQTNERDSQSSPSVPNNVLVPQREPIAYDISLENHKKPREKPRSKPTLQEALKEKRPDFLHDSELRRKAIQEISQMRRMGILDSNFTPHLFTYHEVRKRTEELYRQLPEFRERNRGHQNKDTIVSNRIKASVFQKKLQSRVLQGQLNLPHSTCL